MSITLLHQTGILKGEIHLTSSKSESNRALIIQALCNNSFEIENLSISNDTKVLQQLLSSSEKELSVGLAGTAMRFLTAYYAIQDKELVLTGKQRMKERPIKVLVETLKHLGAEITYTEKEGLPPIKINGRKILGGKVKIDGSVSSQYISALLMVAPKLDNGLEITFDGEVISKPYINMTIEMMRFFGAKIQLRENTILVEAANYIAKDFNIAADWSAASYWYSMVALAKEADITLYGLKRESLQGDAVVQEVYKSLGVKTEFVKGGIRLTKSSEFEVENLEVDFIDYPDIAQTFAVTCAALNVKAKLTGLKTLRIKETDRIAALQIELTKLGYSVEVDKDDILINKIDSVPAEFTQPVKTYDDHRMAMTFAPLSLLNEITIEDENVVGKSYPNFWKDLEKVDFVLLKPNLH